MGKAILENNDHNAAGTAPLPPACEERAPKGGKWGGLAATDGGKRSAQGCTPLRNGRARNPTQPLGAAALPHAPTSRPRRPPRASLPPIRAAIPCTPA